MTSFLFEDPRPMIGLIVAVELILLGVIFVTGRGIILGAMALVGVLGGGLFLLEQVVVTDAERVESVLEQICEGLESNDVDRVLVHIDPQASSVRQTARTTLPQLVIKDVVITKGPDTEVDMFANPPTAVTRFNVRVEGNVKSGGGPYDYYFRRFEVTFEQHDGRWLMTAYKDFSVR